MTGRKPLVLFLCTHNAARSQMAEALLRRMAGVRFDTASAGLEPTTVHPYTRQALAEVGIEVSSLHAKPVGLFLGKMSVNHAVIVCESVEGFCPRIYPFAVQTVHWPFADPMAGDPSPEAALRRFRATRDAIEQRIKSWLTTL